MARRTLCRVPLWLDCDPGHDDAIAILLAAYGRRRRQNRMESVVRLAGVSSVAGNQSVDKTHENAVRVLDAYGVRMESRHRNIAGLPVIRGQASPLVRPPTFCPEIHGDSGLDAPGGGPLYPPAAQVIADPADDCGLSNAGDCGPVAMYKRIRAIHSAHAHEMVNGAYNDCVTTDLGWPQGRVLVVWCVRAAVPPPNPPLVRMPHLSCCKAHARRPF